MQRHGPPHVGLELHRVQRRREVGQARLGIPPKREPRLVALDQDRLQSRPGAERAEFRHEEQPLHGLGAWPEALAQFLAQGSNLAWPHRARQPPIHVELRRGVGHVIVRQVRGLVQHHIRRRPLHAAFAPPPALQRFDRFLQPTQVHVVPHGVRVPRLLAAQQVARAADLQITQRDAVARPQIGMMLEHPQTFLGVGVEQVGHHEVAVGAAVAAAHAPAQLIQLRQTELIGAVHDHRVGVGHVEPRLDDHGRHQHVHFAAHEAAHHVVERMLGHLAVRHGDARPRRQCLHPRGDRIDRVDAVVDEEHLAAAIELARHRLLQQRVVPGLDEREHRGAVLGRCFQQREVAQPREREVQRAGYRRSGEGQDVDRQLQRLEPLLVLHAEAVLLVHNHQADVAKRHVARQQAMGADHHIHVARGEPLADGGRFPRAAEPRQHLDPHRIVGQALAERAAVLLGENRRRDEDRHLFPRLHALEGSPNRHFRLAVAHIAHEQAVHRPRPLHVALDLFGRAPLVGGVLIKEGGFELPLPRRVGREGEAGRQLPAGVKIEQFRRQRADRRARLVALALPGTRAQPVQTGRRSIGVTTRAVGLELVEPVQRHIEAVAALVLDHRHFERALAHLEHLQAPIDADAVLQVDHVIARLQRPRSRRRGGRAVAARAPQPAGAPEDLMVGQHPQRRQHETAVQRPHDELRAVAADQLVQAFHLAFVVAQDHGARLGRYELPQIAQVAVDRLRGCQREPRQAVRSLFPERERAERRQALAPHSGREEQLGALRGLLAEPARHVEMMRRFRPRAVDLLRDRVLPIEHQQRARGQQLEQ